MTPVRVLYIGGWGRSGSTILGNVLNGVPGFWHGGEILWAWRYGMAHDRLCGCGRPFPACPVWSEVVRSTADPDGAAATGRRVDQALWAGPMNRHALPLLDRAAPPVPEGLRARLGGLYRAVRDVTAARVIVDGSKFPFYARLLLGVPEVEVHVLHLVRDPRATAYSWSKTIVRSDVAAAEPMPRFSPARSTAKWLLWNAATERLGREAAGYLRVRYEDAVADPRGFVARVGAWLGEDVGPLGFIDGPTVTLGPSHTIWGNPTRGRAGPVVLRADEAWRTAMPRADRALVGALAAPLALRYGYR